MFSSRNMYVIVIVAELMLFLLCLQTRQSFTAEQVNEATYVDIRGNKAVFDSLRNNPKVLFDGSRFTYKVNAFNIVLLAVLLVIKFMNDIEPFMNITYLFDE